MKIEVVGYCVYSGTSKKTGKPYNFTKVYAITDNNSPGAVGRSVVQFLAPRDCPPLKVGQKYDAILFPYDSTKPSADRTAYKIIPAQSANVLDLDA